MEKERCEIELEAFLKNDERTISVGKQTERFIKLYLATSDLSSAISNALEIIYNSRTSENIFEETFQKHIFGVLEGLRNYIGISIENQTGYSMNVTNKHINI